MYDEEAINKKSSRHSSSKSSHENDDGKTTFIYKMAKQKISTKMVSFLRIFMVSMERGYIVDITPNQLL